MGLLVAMMSVGRARAADPAWMPGPSDAGQYQLSGRSEFVASAELGAGRRFVAAAELDPRRFVAAAEFGAGCKAATGIGRARG